MKAGEIWVSEDGTHPFEILRVYDEHGDMRFDYRFVGDSAVRWGFVAATISNGHHPDEVTMAKRIIESYE